MSERTSPLQCTSCASLVVTWIGCGTHWLNFQISKDRQPWQTKKSDPLSIATPTRLQIEKKKQALRDTSAFVEGKKRGHCALNAIRFTATDMITTHRRQSSKAKKTLVQRNYLAANSNSAHGDHTPSVLCHVWLNQMWIGREATSTQCHGSGLGALLFESRGLSISRNPWIPSIRDEPSIHLRCRLLQFSGYRLAVTWFELFWLI